MKKWEYLFINYSASSNSYKPTLSNNKAIDTLDKELSIYEYANKLGDLGWELVGFVPQTG